MSNLRSDARDHVADLPAGDLNRCYIERLCHQIDYLEELWIRSNKQIVAIRNAVEEIVCTEGEDTGVVLKDHESPTRYDADLKCQVYQHENFSPLGDSLVKLHGMCVIPRSKTMARATPPATETQGT